MKTSLIIFGIIFLVAGAFFYFMPAQTAGATTTNIGEEGASTQTSYATVTIPRPLTYALLLIGLVLTVLGLTLGNAREPRIIDETSQVVTDEHEEHIEEDEDGVKKTTHRHRSVHKEAK